ncbi:MAG: DUF2199 domain-containing protein [Deltaproteobacteria bacterium]
MKTDRGFAPAAYHRVLGRLKSMEFVCERCTEIHHVDLDSSSFGAGEPAQWWLLSSAERAESELSSDQCIIHAGGETSYFVAAVLEIPIAKSTAKLKLQVWVSLSCASFEEAHAHWHDPARTETGPYFGWLSTAVPGYPDTMFLKTRVHQRPVGLRPRLELQVDEHPLAVHQHSGIGPRELAKLLSALMHDDDDAIGVNSGGCPTAQ